MEDMTVFCNSSSIGAVMMEAAIHLFQMHYHKSGDMKSFGIKTVLVKTFMFTCA